MARYRDVNWNLNDKNLTWTDIQVAVLMDIRDELKMVNSKLDCWRVSAALNGLMELGVKLRREKRNRRKQKSK